jgi:hypothetical protein
MGIDYGMGMTNVDKQTGIRFGVISSHKVDHWYESAEPDYGDPNCPKCGHDVVSVDDSEEDFDEFEQPRFGSADYACEHCKQLYDSNEVYGDEAIANVVKDEEYFAHSSCDDGDIFIEKSPYYTRCNFCSPCAPGAGYLTSQGDDCKAYCLGTDWFEDGKAPYSVYRVDNDECVYKLEEENYVE